MKMYTMRTTISRPDALINFSNPRRLFEMIRIIQAGNRAPGDYSETATAQPGYTLASIAATDYLDSVPTYPVFSRTAGEAIRGVVSDDLVLVDLNVVCDQSTVPLLLGILRRRLPLIDRERTEFRTLAGTKVPWRVVVDESLEDAFYVAQDIEYSRFYASERFRELAQKLGLAIDFVPVQGADG